MASQRELGTNVAAATSSSRRDLAVIGGLALFKVLIHLPILTRYGYHHDELYFLACGQHLSSGYVDHAPLVPWIARLSTALFGQSLAGLRILPVLAGAAAVFLAGLIARRMGGGRFAQVMTCLTMIAAPAYLRAASMLCLPAFELFFWTLTFYVLVRIVQDEDLRRWPWLGSALGLGLLAKHSTLFLGFGIVVGLAATPLRRHFRSLRLYATGLIAFLFLAPNLVWQAGHGWPTAGFLIHLRAGTLSGISPPQFVFGQLLYIGPLNAVIWIWGMVYLFGRNGGRFRIFAWIWLAVFAVLALLHSKIYYLAPAYPPLLAAGSIALEQWIREKGRAGAWLRPAAAAAIIAAGAAMVPLCLPILPVDRTEVLIRKATFGTFKNVYELTADFRGMFGWEERVDALAGVYRNLPPEERKRTIIMAEDYGIAGAVDLFGPARGLPKASSFDMTYWIWGLPKEPYDTVLCVGFKPKDLEERFGQTRVAARVDLPNVNPWQTPFYVVICRNPKVPLEELRREARPW